jgi:hypothetical protein
MLDVTLFGATNVWARSARWQVGPKLTLGLIDDGISATFTGPWSGKLLLGLLLGQVHWSGTAGAIAAPGTRSWVAARRWVEPVRADTAQSRGRLVHQRSGIDYGGTLILKEAASGRRGGLGLEGPFCATSAWRFNGERPTRGEVAPAFRSRVRPGE